MTRICLFDFPAGYPLNDFFNGVCRYPEVFTPTRAPLSLLDEAGSAIPFLPIRPEDALKGGSVHFSLLTADPISPLWPLLLIRQAEFRECLLRASPLCRPLSCPKSRLRRRQRRFTRRFCLFSLSYIGPPCDHFPPPSFFFLRDRPARMAASPLKTFSAVVDSSRSER